MVALPDLAAGLVQLEWLRKYRAQGINYAGIGDCTVQEAIDDASTKTPAAPFTAAAGRPRFLDPIFARRNEGESPVASTNPFVSLMFREMVD